MRTPARLAPRGLTPLDSCRELPPSGIELSSPQGIALFQRALAAGTATPFFKLVEQLATQSEPAFCGLASLVTILNAIGVDPKRPWKGPWRYYRCAS